MTLLVNFPLDEEQNPSFKTQIHFSFVVDVIGVWKKAGEERLGVNDSSVHQYSMEWS